MAACLFLQPSVASAQGSGPLGSVTISLSEQQAYLYRPDGSLVTKVPVSSGSRGRTPKGTYHVYRKVRVGTSGTDRNVHMDFFTVFNGGIGMHGIPWSRNRGNRLATPLGVRPVSHGCIRMNDADAEWIYNNLPYGAEVRVVK
jgi:lipoprotein-anchoring transpeptidase ErfK/SrfK